MSPEFASTTPQSTSISFSPSAYARIEADAKLHGMSAQTYLLALSAVQSKRVSPEVLKALGELYTHDHETLRELAK
jgi:hypothetical protein